MAMRRWWTVPLVLGCLLLGALSSERLLAQDKNPAAPLDRGELDANIYKALRTVINEGADLYNSGEWAACYHLYRGALLTLRPVLQPYRPALVKEIDEALVAASRSPQVGDRAFVLRDVLNKIRAETAPMVAKPRPTPPQPPRTLTLWDRLGGEKGVSQVVDNFLTTSLADPKVNFYRKPNANPTPEQIATLKKQLVELLSSMTGGPYDYKGKTMKEAHKGMNITNAQFDAMIGHIRNALVGNGAQSADITLVLEIVESTRKDIVQAPPAPPAPKEEKPAPPETIGKPAAVPLEKKPEEPEPQEKAAAAEPIKKPAEFAEDKATAEKSEEEPELLKNLPEVKNPE